MVPMYHVITKRPSSIGSCSAGRTEGEAPALHRRIENQFFSSPLAVAFQADSKHLVRALHALAVLDLGRRGKHVVRHLKQIIDHQGWGIGLVRMTSGPPNCVSPSGLRCAGIGVETSSDPE